MDRFLIKAAAGSGNACGLVSPALALRLRHCEGARTRFRFGTKEAEVTLAADPSVATCELHLSPDVLDQLCLPAPLTLTTAVTDDGQVILGPLVGLLISASKLQSVKDGRRDAIYCRYSRYAREGGITLFFFTAPETESEKGIVTGYLHQCSAGDTCSWRALRFPFPQVVYDRCFGAPGREQALEIRSIARELGAIVLNNLPKLTKLQTCAALSAFPELAPHLPYSALLTPESLARAMEQHDDLYLKPDALYKGKGIYRLTRREAGWLLQSREEYGNAIDAFSSASAVQKALADLLPGDTSYLIQEGLPLARYLGNRFDLRSMVQKDGRGAWQVTGLVTRIAPEGSVITSPRSGGQIAPAVRTLQSALPDRWESVLADLNRTSIEIAEGLDQQLGPWAELGLDMAVLADGSVKLIEANGKPLRVSLDRLGDPAVMERINRFPIHYAAWLDLKEVAPCYRSR